MNVGFAGAMSPLHDDDSTTGPILVQIIVGGVSTSLCDDYHVVRMSGGAHVSGVEAHPRLSQISDASRAQATAK